MSKCTILLMIFALSINLNQFITPHPFNNGDEVININSSLENIENLVVKSTETSFEEGIVGYWNFDEATGSIANDSSVNENHGTINGALWNTDGAINSSLDFDGFSDNVQLQHIPEYNFGSLDFTISAWIKTSADSIKERIFSKGSYGFSITGYMMRLNYNKILLETTNQTSYVNMLESNSTVNDGKWHYIVCVVDRD